MICLRKNSFFSQHLTVFLEISFEYSRGMRISDMPMHDSNRDLILMNEHWEEEWNLTQNLEILTDKLQNAYKELEDVKRKTDK